MTSDDRKARSGLPDHAQRHYALGAEESRLTLGAGRLEFARSQELLARFLPKTPATVLDLGGGPAEALGRHFTLWIASASARTTRSESKISCDRRLSPESKTSTLA